MASITAHLMIANRVLNSLPLLDPALFLLGSIAPDSVPSAVKGSTHYTERIADRPYYRWDRFLHDYWSGSASDAGSYVLGYLCHLLADEEWDRYVRFPLKLNPAYMNLPLEDRRARYYKDMSRIDIVVRLSENVRRSIAEYITSARFPAIPASLSAEQVGRCVQYACNDLFKLEEQTETQFLDAEVVNRMCLTAAERTMHLCKCLLNSCGM